MFLPHTVRSNLGVDVEISENGPFDSPSTLGNVQVVRTPAVQHREAQARVDVRKVVRGSWVLD